MSYKMTAKEPNSQLWHWLKLEISNTVMGGDRSWKDTGRLVGNYLATIAGKDAMKEISSVDLADWCQKWVPYVLRLIPPKQTDKFIVGLTERLGL